VLSLHPAFQGLIAIAAFVAIALGLWIAFARSGSRPKQGYADDPIDHA
jgi:hypothetical protein